MSHDDIRQRLAAVEHIDWRKTRREDAEEYYGDWLRIGPLMLMTSWRPEPHDAESVSQRNAISAFLQHAVTDLRRLLADLDHATTTREAIMPSTNPVYGPPPDPERGEPARYLADAVEVQRPNGDVVRMDLVALADAAINADRAVAGLREENEQLRRKLATLEEKVSRIERAGRILAGGYEED
ncbi:hypothetical protein ACU635_50765 [[Actinomadura] parvosata]|uniref:hypothetical protein n=1 Tax=[Actinomadura] parvosata TaxID=1955412 RepID=UPI00406BF0F4